MPLRRFFEDDGWVGAGEVEEAGAGAVVFWGAELQAPRNSAVAMRGRLRQIDFIGDIRLEND
jgi:hypothetical protein